MPNCQIIAGPNGAGKTTFAGENPTPVFEQYGNDRHIIHDHYYQLLLEGASC